MKLRSHPMVVVSGWISVESARKVWPCHPLGSNRMARSMAVYVAAERSRFALLAEDATDHDFVVALFEASKPGSIALRCEIPTEEEARAVAEQMVRATEAELAQTAFVEDDQVALMGPVVHRMVGEVGSVEEAVRRFARDLLDLGVVQDAMVAESQLRGCYNSWLARGRG